MGFNLRVLLHVAGLLLTVIALAACWSAQGYYATFFTLTLALLLQVSALIRFIGYGNRELARFLIAVQHGDFSQSFRYSGQYPGFEQLGVAFEGVLERLRRERSDKEVQAAYLQTFVQQLPIAVFNLHEDGRISLANHACLQLLGLKELHHLRDLESVSAQFASVLAQLNPRQEQSLQVKRLSTQLDLRLTCALLRSKGLQYKLVSLLDIKSALESREMEAWHNLIRVMTHEIMNSITPLTSLADTSARCLMEAREQLLAQPEAATSASTHALLDDAVHAATTISKRGQSLLRFVDSYRQLTKLPVPQPKLFPFHELAQRVLTLYQERAAAHGVKLVSLCEQAVMLHADQDLLEQALINLVNNAFDAVQNRPAPAITLEASYGERGSVWIKVSDNGTGMDSQVVDNIFIPFYTTKRGGSGIGLSLVKQIVQANSGSIVVTSTPNIGTTFTLSFL